MYNSNRLLLSIGSGLGIIVVSGFGYWCYRTYKKNLIPKKWRRVGTLEELYFFPLKSSAAIKLQPNDEVNCELLGLHWQGIYDRCLILLDQNYGIVTGRTYPKMILIKSEFVAPNILRFTADGMEPIEINFEQFSNERSEQNIVLTSVHGSKLTVSLCGEIFDKWFSEAILGKPKGLHLARYHHDKPVRPVFKNMKHEPHISVKDTGTLGDATSYNLMNMSSIDDVNKRLKEPTLPIQFRGNFYLKMDHDEPYAEDKWNWIKIGNDNIFRVVGPYTDCTMPNINPITGERHPDFEPLKTLKTYRKAKNYAAPPLGVDMGLRQRGVVKLNDIIYVEDE